MAERPIAIEVKDLHKSFRMPSHRVSTIKERAVRPFSPIDYTTLHALRGISFRVAQGEFMGIAGRNGSGKTTLLKLLASIYRADRGRIRVAGTLAPLIELGVGFNPNLTARENVLLNGVMMGMTPREARSRFDKIIEFAELEEFVEMKLKNYSSGMSMRLAFAVMVQSDADVLMVDEVLAVGDASFAQKCADALPAAARRGPDDPSRHPRHGEPAVALRPRDPDRGRGHRPRRRPCRRGERYLQINFTGPEPGGPASTDGARAGAAGRIADVWLENSEGERSRDSSTAHRSTWSP